MQFRQDCVKVWATYALKEKNESHISKEEIGHEKI